MIKRRVFFSMLFFLVLTSVSFAAEKTWNAKMSTIAKSLSTLMPLIFDASKFEDPANKETLTRELKVLHETSRSLSAGLKSHGEKAAGLKDDPSVQYLASEFESQIEFANESLRTGELAESRQALKPALSYCISCHTRSSQGPSFPSSPFKISLENLRPIDRMAVLSATRQYDPVLKELPEALRAARGDIYQIEYAVKLALAVSVRVKNNPSDAIKVLDVAKTAPDLPESTEKTLKSWRVSAVAWAAEAQAKKAQPGSALEKAEALLQSADKAKAYVADTSADLEYLRASALAHEYLREPRDSALRARAYLALGRSYDALRDLGFWDLQNVYYEACVKELPNSELARNCVAKLEESLVLGFTGSGGTRLPGPVKRKIEELKKLAAEKGRTEK